MFPYQLSVTSYQLSKTGIILFYITNLSEKCYTARGDNLNFCVGWVMSIAHFPQLLCRVGNVIAHLPQ